jgi:hypothetical protein
MTYDAGTTYPFAVPSPQIEFICRNVALGVLMVSLAFACIWLVKGVLVVNMVVGWIMLTAGAFVLPFTDLASKKRSRLVTTPAQLIVVRWNTRREIAWRDVASIKLEPRGTNNLIDRLLRGDADTPRVKIRFRRWRFLSGFTPTRVLAVYLQDGERFVQDAQQHLTPVTG